MPKSIIRLSNVSRHYKLYNKPSDRLREALNPFKKIYHKKHHVLKGIDLDVKKGEVLGVVGRNGSGKSTLLKLIANILQPNEGKLQVNGNISALLELGAGFNQEFTGVQNIYFIATVQGVTRKRIDGQLQAIIDFADIGEYINQPLKSYSSGMRARLSFAIAVHIEPEILILDEVFAVGDELFRRKCYAKMEEYFKGGKTIIYVSHDANSIIELCTRAILLDSSSILLQSDPKTVISYYQKLLYADEAMKAGVREEIRKIGLKHRPIIPVTDKPDNTARRNDRYEEDYYISSLMPKSTLEYKSYNIRVRDVCIMSQDSRRVNVLVTGRIYNLCSKFVFGTDVNDVGFSFAIKNEKGLDIATFKTLNRDYVNATTGQIFTVKWKFRNSLLPGTYYLNIGVRSYPKNEDSYVLNRIIDVAVFKVDQFTRQSSCGGIVSMEQAMSVSRIV